LSIAGEQALDHQSAHYLTRRGPDVVSAGNSARRTSAKPGAGKAREPCLLRHGSHTGGGDPRLPGSREPIHLAEMNVIGDTCDDVAEG